MAQRGFSLLEILVWMAIAAIAISFVGLAVGSGSRADQFTAETERLSGMMQLAREEAVLTSKPIGLRFLAEPNAQSQTISYEWSVFEQGRWLPLSQHNYFRPASLMAGVSFDIRLEGRGIELMTAEQDEQDEQNSQAGYQPDIFFLHSGEIAPAFEIELHAEALARQYLLEGNPLGQLRMLSRNGFDQEWR